MFRTVRLNAGGYYYTFEISDKLLEDLTSIHDILAYRRLVGNRDTPNLRLISKVEEAYEEWKNGGNPW